MEYKSFAVQKNGFTDHNIWHLFKTEKVPDRKTKSDRKSWFAVISGPQGLQKNLRSTDHNLMSTTQTKGEEASGKLNAGGNILG